MASEDSLPGRWQAVLAVTMTVIALELVSVSVSSLSWDMGNWSRSARKWSIGMPMPAISWVQAEVEWENFDFDGMVPRKEDFSGMSKWDSGLHVKRFQLLTDALVALLLCVGLRRLVPGDERYIVRSVALGASAGVVIEAVSPSVLAFQGKYAWLPLMVCVVLVPLALSLWSRGTSQPRRTPLIMSFVAAWIAFPIVRFGDLGLLDRRIQHDQWSSLENLVVFVVLSLLWLLMSSMFTWWFRRRKRALQEGAV
jgi:hypothetical protein